MNIFNKLAMVPLILATSCYSPCGDQNKDPEAEAPNKSLKVTRVATTPYPHTYRTKAFDGSTVVVRQRASRRFEFYRDIDNDGLADKIGEGFDMLGLSRRTEEHDLSSKVDINSIFNEWKSEEPASSGREDITLENLARSDLRNPIIPDEYLTAIHVSFEDNTGFKYNAVHVNRQKRDGGDYILLHTVGRFDRERFRITHEYFNNHAVRGRPLEKITDRGSDICAVVNLDLDPRKITASSVNYLVGRYMSFFNNVKITTAYYMDVPIPTKR